MSYCWLYCYACIAFKRINVSECSEFNNSAVNAFWIPINNDRSEGVAFIKSEDYNLFAHNRMILDLDYLKRGS